MTDTQHLQDAHRRLASESRELGKQIRDMGKENEARLKAHVKLVEAELKVQSKQLAAKLKLKLTCPRLFKPSPAKYFVHYNVSNGIMRFKIPGLNVGVSFGSEESWGNMYLFSNKKYYPIDSKKTGARRLRDIISSDVIEQLAVLLPLWTMYEDFQHEWDDVLSGQCLCETTVNSSLPTV